MGVGTENGVATRHSGTSGALAAAGEPERRGTEVLIIVAEIGRLTPRTEPLAGGAGDALATAARRSWATQLLAREAGAPSA